MKNKYRIEDDIVYIEIKHKNELFETLIDLEDFERINIYTWYIGHSNSNNSNYVKTNRLLYQVFPGHTRLHRLIMNVTDHKLQVDHINHDTLDNRKSNLRLVTPQENNFNYKNTKGYSYKKELGKFVAQIMINGKTKYLGLFDTSVQAHEAYLEAKKKYHVIGGN